MNIHDQNNRGFLALKLKRAAGKKGETGVSIAKALGIHSTTASKILRGDYASMEMYGKIAEYLGVPMKPEKSLVTKMDIKFPNGGELIDTSNETLLSGGTNKYMSDTPKKLTKPVKQAEWVECIHGNTVDPKHPCDLCRVKKLTKKNTMEPGVEYFPNGKGNLCSVEWVGGKKPTKEDIVQKEKQELKRMVKERDEAWRIPVSHLSGGMRELTEKEWDKIEETRKQHAADMGEEYTPIRPQRTNILPAPIVQNEFTRWQAWVVIALQVVVILFLIFPVK